MSMYKNIFVNEEAENSVSVQIQGIDGSISNFGEGFTSVEAALAGVKAQHSNAVIRVASGKYDGYKVLNEESQYIDVASVVAVDFGGGSVAMPDGSSVAVAEAGFDVAGQLQVIADLNARNAGNGTVYVLAGEDVEAQSTIYVGVNDANEYVAGVKDSAILVTDSTTAENVVTIIPASGNVEIVGKDGDYTKLQDAVDAAAVGDTLRVTGDLAVGGTKINNGKDLTITGNAEFDWGGHFYIGREGSASGADVTEVTFDKAVITSGTMGENKGLGFHISGSKGADSSTKNGVLNIKDSNMDIDYFINRNIVNIDNSDVFISAGFYTHGRSKWESASGSDAVAYTNIANNSYVRIDNENGMGAGAEGDGVISIDDATLEYLNNGTLHVNTDSGVLDNDVNQPLTGDGKLMLAGDAELIAGKVANSGAIILGQRAVYDAETKTVSVENKKFTGELNAEITGNGLLQVVEGDLTTTAGITAGALVVGEAGKDDKTSQTVFGEWEADASASSGASVTIKHDTYLDKENKNGGHALWIGHDYYETEKEDASYNGDTFQVTVDGAQFESNGDSHIGNAGRLDIINGAQATINGHLKVRNELNIGSADDDKNAEGFKASSLTQKSEMNVYGETGVTATANVYDGSSMSVSKLIIGKVNNEARAGELNIAGGSVTATDVTVNVGGSIYVYNGASFVTAGTLENYGEITFTGESTLKTDKLIVGKEMHIGNPDDAVRDKLNLGSYTEDGTMNITGESDTVSKSIRFNDIDVTLTSDVNVDFQDKNFTNAYFRFKHSTLNLNGNDLYIDGKFIADGLDITGKGTITVEPNDQPCWQNFASSIGEEVVFNAAQVTVYENLTVKGQLNSTSGSSLSVGTFATDKKDGKVTNYYSDGAVLKVSGSNAQVNVNGAGIVIYGYDADVDAAIQAYEPEYKLEKSELIVENGASVTVSKTITNNGIITVTDATITAGEITGSGTISLTVTAEMLNSLTGDFVLLEQTGNAAALDLSVSIAGKSYKVGDTFENNGIKFQISGGVGDNDIILDSTIDTLYVNSAYTEADGGFGLTKFNSITAAMQNATGAVKEIVVESNITEAMPTDIFFIVDSDVKITAANAVEINLTNQNTSYDIVMGSDNGSKIIIDKNVSLKLDDRVIWVGHQSYSKDADIEINGVVSANQWWNGGDTTVNIGGKLISSGEALVMRNGSTLKIIGDAANGTASADRVTQLDANYFSFLSGELFAYNTKIESGPLWVNNTDGYAYEGTALIEVSNTVWESSGNFKLHSVNTALFEVLDGSTVSFSNQDGYAASEIGENGFLWIYEGSSFTAKDIVNDGDIDVNGASLTINGTLTNNKVGTVEITDSSFSVKNLVANGEVFIGGTSSVNIDNYDGSYSIRLRDGVTLNDSYFGAKDPQNYGEVRALGDVTIAGDVTIGAEGNTSDKVNLHTKSDHVGDLTVLAGKSLTVNGSLQFYNGDIKGGGKINTSYIILGNNTITTDITAKYGFLYNDVVLDGAKFELISGVDGASLWGGGYAGGDAHLTVRNGGEFIGGTQGIRLDGGEGDASLTVDGASINSDINIVKGWAYFNDADVTAKSIHNEQTIAVSGDTTLKFDEMVTKATTAEAGMENYTGRLMVGYSPQNGTANGYLTEELGTHVTFDSVSGNGIKINANRTYIEDSDITLKDDLTISVKPDTTMKEHRADVGIFRSQVDLGGKTLTINGQANIGTIEFINGNVVVNGVNGKSGRANLTFDGGNGDSAAEDYVIINKDVTVTAKEVTHFNMYAGTIDIAGKVIIEKSVNNVNIGLSGASEPNFSPYGSQVTVSGNGALLSVDVGATIHSTLDNAKANSSLTIEDGAEVSFGGALTNYGVISTDSTTTLSAGSIVNAGKFNSGKDGEAVIKGTVNVTGNFQSETLTLAYGAALNAGSITVTNLTLTIGSTLTLGEGNSSAANITVVGDFNPENAEFILVATNFDKITGHNGTIFYDKDADGIVDDGEEYTIGTAGAGNIIFKQDEKGNLIAKVENAKVEAIYIGDLNGAQAGDKITVTDSEGNKATFTVGTDAFASVNDAADATGVDLSQLEEVHLGSGDHVDDIAETPSFGSVSKIVVDKDSRITDLQNQDHETADFGSRDLNIDNAGHLEANIKTTGNIDMVNSSRNTYFGSMEAGDFVLTNTGVYGDKDDNDGIVQSTITANDVKISQSADAELWNTTISAVNGSVLLDNGIYESVDVNANILNLSNVSELILDDGSVITDNINLGVDANGDNTEQAAKLTLAGAVVNQVTGGKDASGEVIFDGSLLQNTTIEDVDKVVLASGTDSHSFGTAADGREYYMNNLEIGAADLTWNFSDGDDALYNIGTPLNNDEGMIKVTSTSDDAKLTFAQSGEYSLGNFDVSGFGADVEVKSGAELTLKETTDYFADSADLAVEGILNLDGSANVAWDFDGAGAINVNDSHSFTAAGAIDGFTGTVMVADEKALTLSGGNSTAAIFAGAGNIVASADLTLNNTTAAQLNEFTGDIKADGATVTLNSSNNTSATFSGAGIVDVQAEQVLKADGALNNLTGTLNNDATITLKAGNTVQAILTGNGSIVAQADQSFTGNVSAYDGSYTADGATVTYTANSTLAGTMNLNGDGKFTFAERTTAAEITINSDGNATNLDIYNNQVTLDTGKFGDIDDEAGAVIVAGTITAGAVTVTDVTVNDDKSLNAASVSATDLVVKGEVSAGSIDADNIAIYISTDATITVDGNNDFSASAITVYNTSSTFDTPYTLITAGDNSTYAATVKFDVNGAVESIDVNGVSVKIGDKFVQVYTEAGDLIIANFEIKNNVIYVNSDWSSEVGTNVIWNEKQRIVGMDASQTVEQAVEIVRGEDNNGVSEAEIYVVKGDTYTTPAAMMTSTNGVKNLLLKADNAGVDDVATPDGSSIGRGEAQLRGTVTAVEAGLNGDYQFELSNISTRSAVFGGADIRNGEDVANSTTLIIDGGNHMGAQVVGGNFITSAGTYDIESSKVFIKNTSGDKMGISGRVYGGSMIVGQGVNLTQENAEVHVDLTGGEITMRGDIYAGGSNGVTGNSVTVENTKVTFTGEADNLTFTGRVSGGVFGEPSGAIVADDNRFSELVFADFNGTFKGLILDMDVITISGNSEVEFSRKQTLTADTDINFVLDGRTSTEAMFTLNSFGWTYGDITVQTGMFASGEYVLASGADFTGIDIYVGGTQAVIGTELEVNGSKYTFSINDNGTADTADDKLVLNYVNQGLAIDSNSSANVEFSASDVLDANTNGNAVEIAEGGSAEITTNGTVINGNIASNGKLDLNINSGTVNGNITYSGSKDAGNLDVKLTGDVNLNGVIKSSYSGSADQAPTDTVVVENADILFDTNQSDLLATGTGDDTVSITNSSVASMTGSGNINLGTGNDNLTVSESTITTDGNISTGTDNDILTVNGGAYITAAKIDLGVGENTLNLDVDSVLNATVNIKGSDNDDTLNITGFAQLAGTQGAVKLVKEFDYYAKYLQFDGEIVGTAGSGDFGSYGNEESKVKQVIGGATPETDDDVWAQLVKTSDDGLIIAWSNEAENIGDVLTEFNKHTVDLGTAVIAEIGSDSFTEMDHEEFSTKKNNGTLA